MPDQPVNRWGAEALWEQLVPLLPGLSVEVVQRTLSTNTALLERARATPDAGTEGGDAIVRRSVESSAFGRRSVDLQPCLLVAEQQSGGRGRMGRIWQSLSGASLTFSLSLPMAAADWSGLSLAVGVALAEALDSGVADTPGPHIGLKWPNDLWLMDGPLADAPPGRKLGGVLIETVAAGDADRLSARRLVIVGVGLNVLPFDAPEANSGFASLQEIDPASQAPAMLAQVALPLVQALQRFEREGFAAFAERFAARDLLRGRQVRTTSPDAPEGIADGLTAQGALRVRTPHGTVNVSSGEVSVRLVPDA